MKTFILSVLIIFGIIFGALWLNYGTVSPCGILEKEGNSFVMSKMDISSPFSAIGAMIGAKFGESIVDSMSPLQCTKAMSNLKLGTSFHVDIPFISHKKYDKPSELKKTHWFDSDYEDEFTKEKTYYVHGYANEKEYNNDIIDINVRCKNNKTELYIDWNEYLLGDNSDRIKIELKLDDVVKNELWGLSTNNKATFSPNGWKLAKELMNHKTLLVRYTDRDHSRKTAEFDLSNYSESIQNVGKQCHWLD